MKALIVATIVLGLAVDQYWPGPGQHVATAAAWATFALLWARSPPGERPYLLACLLFATAGEVFLSLVWGLYDYRLGNIPLFVPPGHVLLFFLGMQVANRLTERMAWIVAAIAVALVTALALAGRDTLGPLLVAFFLACMALSPSRRLYATMFVLSLAMELYGTWLGNWTWSASVPWLGLVTQNPPVAAGAFYCVLDFLVVSTVAMLRRYPASPIVTPSTPSHQAAACSARSSSR